jgi:uncharacterized protein (TIGR02996 family)
VNQADGLLAAVLERPADQAGWLVLADWLEEQGDPASLARAELLRLQVERNLPVNDPLRQQQADQRAAEVLAAHRGLVGAMQPLLRASFPVLAAPTALAMFLLAEQTSAIEGPLAAGTTWEGELQQRPYAFPTTLRLRRRQGNLFQGDMVEDFSSLHAPGVLGTFDFRGVVAGRAHVAFVTYRTRTAGICPGLYQLQLSRLGRLSGTWWVPGWSMRGRMWLARA